MNKLQGHEFASSGSLKDLHDSALPHIELLAQPHGELEQYQAMAFTEAGLRQIAPDHMVALRLAVGLGVDFNPEDKSIRFHWRGDDQASFDVCSLQVDPKSTGYSGFRYEELKTRGPDENLGINIFSPRRFEDLDEETADILHNRVQNALLETKMGNHNALTYEVVALTGIMRAITETDPAKVKVMLCTMDAIDAKR